MKYKWNEQLFILQWGCCPDPTQEFNHFHCSRISFKIKWYYLIWFLNILNNILLIMKWPIRIISLIRSDRSKVIITYYWCGEKNHSSRDCRNSIVCFECGRLGIVHRTVELSHCNHHHRNHQSLHELQTNWIQYWRRWIGLA
jgi:hypothetical protein